MPSIDRSMLPIRMMKVAPMHSTMGMAAALSRRRKFEIDRKLELNRLMRTHRASSTATGAHTRQRVTIAFFLATAMLKSHPANSALSFVMAALVAAIQTAGQD